MVLNVSKWKPLKLKFEEGGSEYPDICYTSVYQSRLEYLTSPRRRVVSICVLLWAALSRESVGYSHLGDEAFITFKAETWLK